MDMEEFLLKQTQFFSGYWRGHAKHQRAIGEEKYDAPRLQLPLCNGSAEESLIHLFLNCPFATQYWALLNIQVDFSLDPFQKLQSFKNQLQVSFFTEVTILMCWTFWKARNDLILPPDKSKFADFKGPLQIGALAFASAS